MRLNYSKAEISVDKVAYFGHVLSSKGLEIDPAKDSAVKDMVPSSSKKELETFLGMVNYLSKFSHNIAKDTVTLRKLVHKNTHENMNLAFNRVKNLIA